MRTPDKYILASLLLILLTGCAGTPTSPSEIEGVREPQACDGLPAGSVREGFLAPHTTGDIPCITGAQTCTFGKWVGPTLYESCLNYTKSCDGMPHGTTESGFLEPTTLPGMSCTPATRSCVDGSWVGAMTFYPTCTELQ